MIKSQRVLRWPLLLEEFNYTFQYTPGKDNKVADMLSRFPIIPVHQHQIISMAAVDNNNFPISFATIHRKNDTFIQAGVLKSPSLFHKQSVYDIQLVFYRNKIVIPTTLVQPIINWYHVHFIILHAKI